MSTSSPHDILSHRKVVTLSSLTTLPDGKTRAAFEVPASEADALIAAPVTCRGGFFHFHFNPQPKHEMISAFARRESIPTAKMETESITSCEMKHIYVEFLSSRAKDTAEEIQERIEARIRDPRPPGIDELCTTSSTYGMKFVAIDDHRLY